MEFRPTRLRDVVLIEPVVFEDGRGFFLESWRKSTFAEHGIDANFVQDNHARSGRFTLRGLHYQVRQPQGKLVRVIRGAIYDVAVDLRASSPSFGQWVGAELSAENRCMVWVPPGFAHGYLALSETVDLVYTCTDYYAPQFERAVRWNDRQLGIHWPLPEGVAPILSAKDEVAPSFCAAEHFP